MNQAAEVGVQRRHPQLVELMIDVDPVYSLVSRLVDPGILHSWFIPEQGIHLDSTVPLSYIQAGGVLILLYPSGESTHPLMSRWGEYHPLRSKREEYQSS